MRILGWVQGGLAAMNLAVGGLWLFGLAAGDCGGFPLLAGIASVFVAGFLAAGGMWSLVYRAGQFDLLALERTPRRAGARASPAGLSDRHPLR